jgi:hypothetical protein
MADQSPGPEKPVPSRSKSQRPKASRAEPNPTDPSGSVRLTRRCLAWCCAELPSSRPVVKLAAVAPIRPSRR